MAAKLKPLPAPEPVERHTLSILVDNEAGVLGRITIVTSGPRRVIDQIRAQLDRLVPVHSITDLSELGPFVERELALVKVAGVGEKRVEALRLADIFRARPVDTTTQSFVFEISGSTTKVDQFIELMREVGLVEVARGGVVALSRGATAQ